MSKYPLLCQVCGERPYEEDGLCQPCIDEFEWKAIPFTYRELKEKLSALPEERLDDPVVYFDNSRNEFFRLGDFRISTATDILDESFAASQANVHAYLTYEKGPVPSKEEKLNGE